MDTNSLSSPPTLSPTALTLPQAAALLSRAYGKRVDEAKLQADIDAGAPTNRDGTLNLVHYAAWLVRSLGTSAGGADGE